jgi:hypothetical protein
MRTPVIGNGGASPGAAASAPGGMESTAITSKSRPDFMDANVALTG